MMLLSIDGLMAADLEPESGMETGDEVRITFTDGTTIEGTVESVNTASCTVTMADDAVGVGEIVTVADGNGNVIGPVSYTNLTSCRAN